MKLKTLDSFLYCFDLKTGVLVIGILGLLSSSGTVIIAPLTYRQFCSNEKSIKSHEECGEAFMRLIELVVSSSINLILMGLMVVGSQQESSKLLLPVLVLDAIGIIITFIGTWYLSIFAVIFTSGYGLALVLIGNITVGIMSYFWMVVYSRREEIKREKIAEGQI